MGTWIFFVFPSASPPIAKVPLRPFIATWTALSTFCCRLSGFLGHHAFLRIHLNVPSPHSHLACSSRSNKQQKTEKVLRPPTNPPVRLVECDRTKQLWKPCRAGNMVQTTVRNQIATKAYLSIIESSGFNQPGLSFHVNPCYMIPCNPYTLQSSSHLYNPYFCFACCEMWIIHDIARPFCLEKAREDHQPSHPICETRTFWKSWTNLELRQHRCPWGTHFYRALQVLPFLPLNTIRCARPSHNPYRVR